MTDTKYQKEIIELVSQDAQRLQALDAVFHLGLGLTAGLLFLGIDGICEELKEKMFD
ncbi:hypothetical protein [Vibrio sp. MA40-2]|uniref:hypothetical protein n=1 Tax=Vibrio sp. MA40-2 TaxID=3391828 RepID=UPI0039A5E35E